MSQQNNRKKSRKLLYQKLFATSFHSVENDLFYHSFYDDVFTFSKDDAYIDEMTEIILEKEAFFLGVIEKFSPKFDIEKMSPVNLIALFIPLAEMFFLKEEIPAKVSVNEAVEIAKTYSDESSKKMVNGILHSVINNYESLEKEKDSLKVSKSFSIFKQK